MLSKGFNGTEIKRKTEVKWPVQNQWFFVLNTFEINLSQLSSPFFDRAKNFCNFFAAVDNMFGFPFQVRGGKY